MPVPALPRNSAEPNWYYRARGSDERYLLEIEDEWEADHEDDPDYIDVDELSIEDMHLDDQSDDDEEYEDISVHDEELQELAAEREEAERSGRPWNESMTLQAWRAPPELPAHTQVPKRFSWHAPRTRHH